MDRKLAVKEIAYFLYSSGDLSAEYFSNASNENGTKAHQYLQRKYLDDDTKEYYIKKVIEKNGDNIEIHGYIDGVLKRDGQTIIEEIKSTKIKLDDIDLEYHKEHLAQAKLYAYMFADINQMDFIKVRMTYIKTSDYSTKSFDIDYSFNELELFFFDSLNKYLDWLYIIDEKNKDKMTSINAITFPYRDMREGQREMMASAYYTLTHNDILYTIAPTGIGKTMASLFSGLKSLKSEEEKLFYLTSKNLQKEMCLDAVKILEGRGLKLKTLELTSKAKSCLCESKSCDPDKCPFAKGFFDRARDAIDDIFPKYYVFTNDIIIDTAKQYNICPYEFSLNISNYCDCIICDYNYVFDPRAHLIRYFDDDTYKPKILIDEAHNLVSRSKDMYTSSLYFSDIEKLYDLISKYDPSLFKYVIAIKDEFNNYDKLMVNDNVYYSIMPNQVIINTVTVIKNAAEEILSFVENLPNRDEVLTYYFILKDYLDKYEFFGEQYKFIVEKIGDDYKTTLSCMDASEFIYETIKEHCYGVVLFSATLYPIDYYMNLISKGNGKYLDLESPFDKNNMDLILNTKISTRYKDRDNTINDVIEIVDTLVFSYPGNHIVFFPSYKYMELFLNNIDMKRYNLVIQQNEMTEIERINLFEQFKDTTRPHLGLFVLGGSFSEGLDFKDDLLNGVVVVGVGIPQMNIINDLSKEYFDDKYGMGYDYAYTYPGFNKVVQASGRVIRNETDRGAIILIDDRYRLPIYKKMMPKHWDNYKIVNDIPKLKKELEKFFGDE